MITTYDYYILQEENEGSSILFDEDLVGFLVYDICADAQIYFSLALWKARKFRHADIFTPLLLGV
jgi:hypothetical protein